MEKSSQNIQDSFLNNARKEKMILTVYLMGGVRLNGRIKSFDKYSLILEANNQEHLVFKHAISTVACARQSHTGPSAGGTAESGSARPDTAQLAPGSGSGSAAGNAPGSGLENTEG